MLATDKPANCFRNNCICLYSMFFMMYTFFNFKTFVSCPLRIEFNGCSELTLFNFL